MPLDQPLNGVAAAGSTSKWSCRRRIRRRWTELPKAPLLPVDAAAVGKEEEMEGAPMGNRVTQALLMDAAACGELGDGRTRGEEEEPKIRASPVGK